MPEDQFADEFNEPEVGEDPDSEEPEADADPFGDPEALDRLREEAERSGAKGSHRSFWRELPFLIVVALVVAVLIKTFLVQAFYIPSASMRDTLIEGDRVMVNKLAFRFGDPSPGDVIVFDSPLEPHDDGESFLGAVIRNIGEALGLSTPESVLIKRVIAVEGETIQIRDNTVFIDGAPLAEPYLSPSVDMGPFGPETVEEGRVFVMGDNRNQSEDSRRFGTIEEDTIIGRAFVKVWPPSRWGGI